MFREAIPLPRKEPIMKHAMKIMSGTLLPTVREAGVPVSVVHDASIVHDFVLHNALRPVQVRLALKL